MAQADLFTEFVLTFEDADLLEEWAQEYGHINENIVQTTITRLRNRSLHNEQTQENHEINVESTQIEVSSFIFFILSIVK